MSLSITCWGLAAVLCLLKSFVYVPHFRFASHLLAEQLIRVVTWPDSLCPTHGRFNMFGLVCLGLNTIGGLQRRWLRADG